MGSWVYTPIRPRTRCIFTFLRLMYHSFSKGIGTTGRGVRRTVVYSSFKRGLNIKDVTFFYLTPSVSRKGDRRQGIVLWTETELSTLRNPQGLLLCSDFCRPLFHPSTLVVWVGTYKTRHWTGFLYDLVSPTRRKGVITSKQEIQGTRVWVSVGKVWWSYSGNFGWGKSYLSWDKWSSFRYTVF